ncbi:MAG: hypothetical protein K6E36_05880 [Oscillospiraceae bacterium]|nr:hypothetical protein [Oscillospiraceae bacterium]MCR5306009.1 hypothetical protein [Oscillospiraceae bacterium]
MQKPKKVTGAGKVLALSAAVLILLTAAACIYLRHYMHKDTLILSCFTKQEADGTYYAQAPDSRSSIRVESDVDLMPYLADSDAVLTVSGEVTRLRIAHFDGMGVYLPCLCYDYRIHAVISAEPAPEE